MTPGEGDTAQRHATATSRGFAVFVSAGVVHGGEFPVNGPGEGRKSLLARESVTPSPLLGQRQLEDVVNRDDANRPRLGIDDRQ